MHDMAISFDDELLCDLNRARFGHAADIIAAQIEQHQMFGTFFLVGEKFGFEREIFYRRFSTWPCACDRAYRYSTVTQTDKNFRARANNAMIIKVKEI